MIRRLWYRLTGRGVQRHPNPLSEYDAAAQRAIDDFYTAVAVLQPDSFPLVWSETHDPYDGNCMCRPCHRDALDMFADDTIRVEFNDMVRTDPLLTELARIRVRRWTP